MYETCKPLLLVHFFYLFAVAIYGIFVALVNLGLRFIVEKASGLKRHLNVTGEGKSAML